MELPPQIPDESTSKQKRREIEKLYNQVGQEMLYQQSLAEAKQFAADKGAMPGTVVGMYMVNLCLQNNLQQIAQETMEATREFTQGVEQADPSAATEPDDSGGQQDTEDDSPAAGELQAMARGDE